jgi:hypothetical protein
MANCFSNNKRVASFAPAILVPASHSEETKASG